MDKSSIGTLPPFADAIPGNLTRFRGAKNLAGPAANTWAFERYAAHCACHHSDLAGPAYFAGSLCLVGSVLCLPDRAGESCRLPAHHLRHGSLDRRRRNRTGSRDLDRQRPNGACAERCRDEFSRRLARRWDHGSDARRHFGFGLRHPDCGMGVPRARHTSW